MKKIFTSTRFISHKPLILVSLLALLFISCKKEKVQDNNAYWLSQERGNIVYKSNYCGIYVVQTNYGFTIIQNLDGQRTLASDLIYGDFGSAGSREFFNYTTGVVTRGQVLDFDLSYNAALAAMDYFCPMGKSAGERFTATGTAGVLKRVRE